MFRLVGVRALWQCALQPQCRLAYCCRIRPPSFTVVRTFSSRSRKSAVESAADDDDDDDVDEEDDDDEEVTDTNESAEAISADDDVVDADDAVAADAERTMSKAARAAAAAKAKRRAQSAAGLGQFLRRERDREKRTKSTVNNLIAAAAAANANEAEFDSATIEVAAATAASDSIDTEDTIQAQPVPVPVVAQTRRIDKTAAADDDDDDDDDDRDLLVNDSIPASLSHFLLIGPDGEKIGQVSRAEALSRAQSLGLDVLLVTPLKSQRHVARLLDYRLYVMAQVKKERAEERASGVRPLKIIQFRPNIATFDLNTKLNKAIRFLQSGHPVKLHCYNARIPVKPDEYRPLLQAAALKLSGVGYAENVGTKSAATFVPGNKKDALRKGALSIEDDDQDEDDEEEEPNNKARHVGSSKRKADSVSVDLKPPIPATSVTPSSRSVKLAEATSPPPPSPRAVSPQSSVPALSSRTQSSTSPASRSQAVVSTVPSDIGEATSIGGGRRGTASSGPKLIASKRPGYSFYAKQNAEVRSRAHQHKDSALAQVIKQEAGRERK